MRETGTIIKINSDTVDISITMNEGCHNCGNKDNCGSLGKIITALKNSHNCSLGDTAVIEIPNASLWVLVVFMIIPLGLLFAGYFAGKSLFNNEMAGNLLGVSGLLVGFAIVFLLGKASIFKSKPYVVEICEKNNS
ncbi:MAG TPA: SoxR reducing system RseC family protein [Spirochaetales bacterium]|nr:SoxR reducing system RseC family protein [Spirochaetales bacterium]HPD79576.1 SoxR reducing system RseC family protein [Spirochaetales bacterium]HQK35392.1 SoxR reducing system RseC family protein [Spirochaetales bacterium]HRV29562.1 SoxR reducing system RseC family protein [Spirochaetia bacterium]